MNTGYRKRVVVLLILLLLGRFWFSQTFELTGPEAYAWMKGQHLDWGYLDQGPLVPLASWVGTFLYHHTESGVRWFSVNIFAMVGFLLFYLGRLWFNPRIGFLCAVIFIVLPMYSWQMILLSESTLSVGFMALTLYALREVLVRQNWFAWIVAGLIIAAATTLDWWNILWVPGFFLFYALDTQRTGRLISPQTVVFKLLALVGFLPYLIWIGFVVGPSGVAWHSWPMLRAHQYVALGGGLGQLILSQLIWWGPLGIIVLAGLWVHRRHSMPFLREHAFFFWLPLPGFLAQAVLGLAGRADQDVMAALWMPWIFLVASLGWRVTEQSSSWSKAAVAAVIFTCFQTLSGFWPQTAEAWWENYAPQPHHPMGNVAQEVARTEREAGASFIIGDTPLDASLLSFYLPLQPFVYVVPSQGLHSQFDLWANYYDFNGGSALYLSADERPLPGQLNREFGRVKRLDDISIPQRSKWALYSCEDFGGVDSAEK